MVHADLSVEKGNGFTQKELKLYAPKSVQLKFDYSPYVGHYGLKIQGPAKLVRKFLKDHYIAWGASFLTRGKGF